MPIRDKQLVERIITYCAEIQETMDYFRRDEARFYSDFIMRNALCMPLQQIGELATHVSNAYIAEHPEIPWKQIKGMRTWFAHQYWDMSFDKIWVTLNEDVPELKRQCEKFLGNNALSDADYAASRRIGIAKGKLKASVAPDMYDDEIAKDFEET